MLQSDKILGRLTWVADLPDEAIPGLPLVEIIDNRRVLIENHHGVNEYGESLIRVKVKSGTICVSGCKLELSRMTKGQLIISGIIECVKLNWR